MLFSEDFYTAGKNFIRTPVVTVATNFKSVCGSMLFTVIKTDLTLAQISEYLGHFNFEVKREIKYDG